MRLESKILWIQKAQNFKTCQKHKFTTFWPNTSGSDNGGNALNCNGDNALEHDKYLNAMMALAAMMAMVTIAMVRMVDGGDTCYLDNDNGRT